MYNLNKRIRRSKFSRLLHVAFCYMIVFGPVIPLATGEDHAVIENCVITNNKAKGKGGGVYLDTDKTKIVNTTISKNRSEASGGGISITQEKSPEIQNTILWGNSSPEKREVDSSESPYSNIHFSDIQQEDYEGTNSNITKNPLFVDDDDYQVIPASPVINQGNPASAPLTDKNGSQRGESVDIGAYETGIDPQVFYVDNANGSDSYDGLAVLLDDDGHGPKKTIQAAIDAAGSSDRIQIAAGIYTGEQNKNLDFQGKNLSIQGTDGYKETIIDCESDGRGFILRSGEDENSVIDGLTIRNALPKNTSQGSLGGAFLLDATSATIKNCLIHSNQAERGAGIYFNNGGGYLINCLIHSNQAEYEGAAFFFAGNTNVTIINCTIMDNDTIETSTNSENDNSTKRITLTNSIFDSLHLLSLSGTLPQTVFKLSYSCLPETLSDNAHLSIGDGNIFYDSTIPLFVGGGDYHLHPLAPVIDKADPESAPEKDLDSVLRYDHQAFENISNVSLTPDMGAYEFNPNETPVQLQATLTIKTNETEAVAYSLISLSEDDFTISGSVINSVTKQHSLMIGTYKVSYVVDAQEYDLTIDLIEDDEIYLDAETTEKEYDLGEVSSYKCYRLDVEFHYFNKHQSFYIFENDIVTPTNGELLVSSTATDVTLFPTLKFRNSTLTKYIVNDILVSGPFQPEDYALENNHLDLDIYFSTSTSGTATSGGHASNDSGINTFERYKVDITHSPPNREEEFYVYENNTVTFNSNFTASITSPNPFPALINAFNMSQFDDFTFLDLSPESFTATPETANQQNTIPVAVSYKTNSTIDTENTTVGDIDTFKRYAVVVRHTQPGAEDRFFVAENDTVEFNQNIATITHEDATTDSVTLSTFPGMTLSGYSVEESLSASDEIADVDNQIMVDASYTLSASVVLDDDATQGGDPATADSSSLDTYERHELKIVYAPFNVTDSIYVYDNDQVTASLGKISVNSPDNSGEGTRDFVLRSFDNAENVRFHFPSTSETGDSVVFFVNDIDDSPDNRMEIYAYYEDAAIVDIPLDPENPEENKLDTYKRYNVEVCFRHASNINKTVSLYAAEGSEVSLNASSISSVEPEEKEVSFGLHYSWILNSFTLKEQVSPLSMFSFTASDEYVADDSNTIRIYADYDLGDASGIVAMKGFKTWKRYVYDIDLQAETPNRDYSDILVKWEKKVETASNHHVLENIIVRSDVPGDFQLAPNDLPYHVATGKLIASNARVVYVGDLINGYQPDGFVKDDALSPQGVYTYRIYTRLSDPKLVTSVFMEDVARIDTTNSNASGDDDDDDSIVVPGDDDDDNGVGDSSENEDDTLDDDNMDDQAPIKPVITGTTGDKAIFLSWSFKDTATGENANFDVSRQILYCNGSRIISPLGASTRWHYIQNSVETKSGTLSVENGVTYKFALKAYDEANNSVVSNWISLTPVISTVEVPEVVDFTGASGRDCSYLSWALDSTLLDQLDTTAPIGFLVFKKNGGENKLVAALPINKDAEDINYNFIDKSFTATSKYTIVAIDKLNRQSKGVSVTIEKLDSTQYKEGLGLRQVRFNLASERPGFQDSSDLWTGSANGAIPGKDEKANLPVNAKSDTVDNNLIFEIPARPSTGQFFQTILPQNDVFSIRAQVAITGGNLNNDPVSILKFKNIDSGNGSEVFTLKVYQDKVVLGPWQVRYFHGGGAHEYVITREYNDIKLYVDGHQLSLTDVSANGTTTESGNAFIRFGARSNNTQIKTIWYDLEYLVGISDYFPVESPVIDHEAPAVVENTPAQGVNSNGKVIVSWPASSESDLAVYRVTRESLGEAYEAFVLGTETSPTISFTLNSPDNVYIQAVDNYGNTSAKSAPVAVQLTSQSTGEVAILETTQDFTNQGFRKAVGGTYVDCGTGDDSWIGFQGPGFFVSPNSMTPQTKWAMEFTYAISPDQDTNGNYIMKDATILSLYELTSYGDITCKHLTITPRSILLGGEKIADFASGGRARKLTFVNDEYGLQIFLDSRFLAQTAPVILTCFKVGNLNITEETSADVYGDLNLKKLTFLKGSPYDSQYLSALGPARAPRLIHELTVEPTNCSVDETGIIFSWQTADDDIALVEIDRTSPTVKEFIKAETTTIKLLSNVPTTRFDSGAFIPVKSVRVPRHNCLFDVFVKATPVGDKTETGYGSARCFNFDIPREDGSVAANTNIITKDLNGTLWKINSGIANSDNKKIELPSLVLPQIMMPLGGDDALIAPAEEHKMVPDCFQSDATNFPLGNQWSFSSYVNFGDYNGDLIQLTAPAGGESITLSMKESVLYLDDKVVSSPINRDNLHHLQFTFYGDGQKGALYFYHNHKLVKLDDALDLTTFVDNQFESVKFGNLGVGGASYSMALKDQNDELIAAKTPTYWAETILKSGNTENGTFFTTTGQNMSAIWNYMTAATPITIPVSLQTLDVPVIHLESLSDQPLEILYGDTAIAEDTWSLMIVVERQTGAAQVTVNYEDRSYQFSLEDSMTLYRLVKTPFGFTLFKDGDQEAANLTAARISESQPANDFTFKIHLAQSSKVILREAALVTGAIDGSNAFRRYAAIFPVETANPASTGIARDDSSVFHFGKALLSYGNSAFNWTFDSTKPTVIEGPFALFDQVAHVYKRGSFGVSAASVENEPELTVGLSNLTSSFIPQSFGELAPPVGFQTTNITGDSVTAKWAPGDSQTVHSYFIWLTEPTYGLVHQVTVNSPGYTFDSNAIPLSLRGRNLDLKIFSQQEKDGTVSIRSDAVSTSISTYDEQSVVFADATPLLSTESSDRMINIIMSNQPDDLQGYVLWRNEPSEREPAQSVPVKIIARLGSDIVERIQKLSTSSDFSNVTEEQRQTLTGIHSRNLLGAGLTEVPIFFFDNPKTTLQIPIGDIRNATSFADKYVFTLDPFDDAVPNAQAASIPPPNTGSSETGINAFPAENVNTISVEGQCFNNSPSFLDSNIRFWLEGEDVYKLMSLREILANETIPEWIVNNIDLNIQALSGADQDATVGFEGPVATDRSLKSCAVYLCADGKARQQVAYFESSFTDGQEDSTFDGGFIYNAKERRFELAIKGTFPAALLSEGDNYFEIEAIDNDGDTTTVKADINIRWPDDETGETFDSGLLVDLSGPVLELVTPENANFGDLIVSGLYEDISGIKNVVITIDGTQMETDPNRASVLNGNFWFNLGNEFSIGQHTLGVTFTDLLGNTSSLSQTFHYDPTPIVVTAQTEKDGDDIVFSGEVSYAKTDTYPKIISMKLNGEPIEINTQVAPRVVSAAGGQNAYVLEVGVSIDDTDTSAYFATGAASHYINDTEDARKPQIVSASPIADSILFANTTIDQTLQFTFDSSNPLSVVLFDQSPGINPDSIVVRAGGTDVTSKFDFSEGRLKLKTGEDLTLSGAAPTIDVTMSELPGDDGSVLNQNVTRSFLYHLIASRDQNAPIITAIDQTSFEPGIIATVRLQGYNLDKIGRLELRSEDLSTNLYLPILEQSISEESENTENAMWFTDDELDVITVKVVPPENAICHFYIDGTKQDFVTVSTAAETATRTFAFSTRGVADSGYSLSNGLSITTPEYNSTSAKFIVGKPAIEITGIAPLGTRSIEVHTGNGPSEVAALVNSGTQLTFKVNNTLLVEGDNTVTFIRYDENGQSFTDSITVEFDNTKPAITFAFDPKQDIIGYHSLYKSLVLKGELASHSNYEICGVLEHKNGIDPDSFEVRLDNVVIGGFELKATNDAQTRYTFKLTDGKKINIYDRWVGGDLTGILGINTLTYGSHNLRIMVANKNGKINNLVRTFKFNRGERFIINTSISVTTSDIPVASDPDLAEDTQKQAETYSEEISHKDLNLDDTVDPDKVDFYYQNHDEKYDCKTNGVANCFFEDFESLTSYIKFRDGATPSFSVNGKLVATLSDAPYTGGAIEQLCLYGGDPILKVWVAMPGLSDATVSFIDHTDNADGSVTTIWKKASYVVSITDQRPEIDLSSDVIFKKDLDKFVAPQSISVNNSINVTMTVTSGSDTYYPGDGSGGGGGGGNGWWGVGPGGSSGSGDPGGPSGPGNPNDPGEGPGETPEPVLRTATLSPKSIKMYVGQTKTATLTVSEGTYGPKELEDTIGLGSGDGYLSINGSLGARSEGDNIVELTGMIPCVGSNEPYDPFKDGTSVLRNTEPLSPKNGSNYIKLNFYEDFDVYVQGLAVDGSTTHNFVELSEPYANAFVDERTLIMIYDEEESESGEIIKTNPRLSFDLMIDDPAVAIAETPKALKPTVYVGETIVSPTSLTYIEGDTPDLPGAYKTPLEIPVVYGINNIEISITSQTGLRSKYIYSVEIGDEDYLKMTPGDLYLISEGSDVDGVQHQIVNRCLLKGEYDQEQAPLYANLTLKRDGRFGRFTKPAIFVDQDMSTDNISATDGVVLTKPGETITLNGGNTVKLFVKGVKFTQKASATRLLSEGSFTIDAYAEKEKIGDDENIELHIISASGATVDLGSGSSSISITPASTNDLFQIDDEYLAAHARSPSITVVTSLPDGKRYDETTNELLLQPDETLFATYGDVSGKAVASVAFTPEAANFEAVTGATHSIDFPVPVPASPAVASVLMHSGELKLSQSLFSNKGRNLAVSVGITYRSGRTTGVVLGPGWNASFEEYFYKTDDTFIYHGPDGREDDFGTDLTPPPGYPWTIAYDETTCVITVKDGQGGATIYSARVGSKFYKPQKYVDRYGSTITYTYDGANRLAKIVDDIDRAYLFNYNENGTGGVRLASITDFNSKSCAFSYDNDGRLKSVSNIGGASLSFAYDANGWLNGAGISGDPDNIVDVTYNPAKPSVTSLVYGVDGLERSHSFSCGGGSSTYTDPDSRTTTYSFSGNLATNVALPGSINIGYQYDPDVLKPQKITQPLGNSTSYTFETSGIRNGRVSSAASVADGRGANGGSESIKTDYTYDGTNWCLLKSSTDSEKSITHHYDDEGNLTQTDGPVVNGKTLVTTHKYNEYGQLTKTTAPNGRITWYQYFTTNDAYEDPTDIEGYLKRVIVSAKSNVSDPGDDPRSSGDYRVTDYGYDYYGRVVTVTDPMGRSTIIAYNDLGQLTDVWSPPFDGENRNHTQYVYDSHGNKTSTTKTWHDPINGEKSRSSSWTYDGLGQLTQATTESMTTTFEYDTLGRNVATQKPDGVWSTVKFDERGYVVKTVPADDDNNPETAPSSLPYYEYVRDNNGNATQTKLNGTNLVTASYDGHDLPIFSFNHETSAVDKVTRDEMGRVKTSTLAPGDSSGSQQTDKLETDESFEYNQLGQTITSADHLFKVNADSAKSDADFNTKIDVVTGETWQFHPEYPDNEEKAVKTSRNVLGQVTSVENPDGTSISYEYNKDGTVSSKTIDFADSDSITISYAYNAIGMLVKETLPDGSFTEYKRDGEGRPVKITDQDGNVTQNEYDSLGRLVATTSNPGDDAIVTSYTYYEDGKLQSITQGAQTTTYYYNDLGQKTKIEYLCDTTTEVENFTYNDRGQMTSHTKRHSNGASDTVVLTYVYDDATRLLDHIESGGRTLREFSDYDASGRARKIVEYNGEDDNDDVTLELEFNSFGQTTRDTQEVYGYVNDVRSKYPDPTGDKAGNRVRLKYPDDSNMSQYFAYNPMNHMTEIGPTSGSSDTIKYTRRGFGTLDKYSCKPGTETIVSGDFSYDSNGRLATLDLNGVLHQHGDFVYTRKHTGLKQSTQFNPPTGSNFAWTQNYTYDSHNRLVTAGYTDGLSTHFGSDSFNLDALDNRTTANTVNGESTDYTIEKATRVTDVSSTSAGYSIQYDSHGNTTKDDLHTYTWDEFDRLSEVIRKEYRTVVTVVPEESISTDTGTADFDGASQSAKFHLLTYGDEVTVNSVDLTGATVDTQLWAEFSQIDPESGLEEWVKIPTLEFDGSRLQFLNVDTEKLRVVELEGATGFEITGVGTVKVTHYPFRKIKYAYDGKGRRVAKIADHEKYRYVYDGYQPIEKRRLRGNLIVQQYVYGEQINEPVMMLDYSNDPETAVKYYFVRDDLNSVHALVDINGNTLERYAYNAYGETVILDNAGNIQMWDHDNDDADDDGLIDVGLPNEGSTATAKIPAIRSEYGTPFGYAGMERDEHTGLYHTHYREYNPKLGRWLTPDPAGYRDGQNLYCYYGGPNNTDPLGLGIVDSIAMSYAMKWMSNKARQLAKATGNSTLITLAEFGEENRQTAESMSTPNMVMGMGISAKANYEVARETGSGKVGATYYSAAMTVSPFTGFAEWYDKTSYRGTDFGRKLDPLEYWGRLSSSTGETILTGLGAYGGAKWIAAKVPKFGPVRQPTTAIVKYDPNFAAKQLKLDVEVPANFTMSNKDVRLSFYDPTVKQINTNLPLTEANARFVSNQRNFLKRTARDLMSDRIAAKNLDVEYPVQPFEYYVEKYSSQGYTGEALWRRIMEGGRTPNAKVTNQFK